MKRDGFNHVNGHNVELRKLPECYPGGETFIEYQVYLNDVRVMRSKDKSEATMTFRDLSYALLNKAY